MISGRGGASKCVRFLTSPVATYWAVSRARERRASNGCTAYNCVPCALRAPGVRSIGTSALRHVRTAQPEDLGPHTRRRAAAEIAVKFFPGPSCTVGERGTCDVSGGAGLSKLSQTVALCGMHCALRSVRARGAHERTTARGGRPGGPGGYRA